MVQAFSWICTPQQDLLISRAVVGFDASEGFFSNVKIILFGYTKIVSPLYSVPGAKERDLHSPYSAPIVHPTVFIAKFISVQGVKASI